METQPRRRRRKINWRVLAIVIALVLPLLIITLPFYWQAIYIFSGHVPIIYGGQLHRATTQADRIVFRNGGFDCHGSVDDDPILYTVTDPAEIDLIRSKIRFKWRLYWYSHGRTCMCCGYPGMDWYKGTDRLALTSIQHGKRIRWKGFSTRRFARLRSGYGDADLTEASAQWLQHWLQDKGIGIEAAFVTDAAIDEITEAPLVSP